MDTVTPWMVGIGTACMAILVSIPLIGWMIKDRRKRIMAVSLTAVVCLAAGLLIGRMLDRTTGPVPPDGGQVGEEPTTK